MTKNKEIFNKIIDFLKNQKNPIKNIPLPYKVTEKSEEEFISYAFRVDNELFDLAPAKEICNKHKWEPIKCGVDLQLHYYPKKIGENTPEYQEGFFPRIHNEYYTVLYDGKKDKLSTSIFSVGYDYAYKKNRYYPYRKNTPLFCLSKHFYLFTFKNKNFSKPVVRHWKPNYSIGTWSFKSNIENIILGINYRPKLTATAKFYYGTKSNVEVLERIHNIKIPKILHAFQLEELNDVITTLKNKNQLNSICQFLSKNKDKFPAPGEEVLLSLGVEKGMHSTYKLYQVIAEMMGIGKDKYWLMRDYVNDLKTLKRTFSLNMTSIKRLEDDHKKATKARLLLGLPDFKVHERYTKFSEQFTIPHELITTKDRLIEEGYDMHHCVTSRASTIASGQCAIFSVKYKDTSYTMDLRCIDEAYCNSEFRGVQNCDPPAELVEQVKKEIQRLNVYFHDNKSPVKEKSTPVLELW